jgi:hypothetical protein
MLALDRQANLGVHPSGESLLQDLPRVLDVLGEADLSGAVSNPALGHGAG